MQTIFFVTKVAGKDVTFAPRSDTLRQHYRSGNGYQVTIEYKIKRIFREIVFLFSSNGCMQPALLSFLSVDSIQALRNAQDSSSILKQESRVSNQAVLTLTGIKILNEFFPDSKKIWTLVEKKARKFVMQDSNLTN